MGGKEEAVKLQLLGISVILFGIGMMFFDQWGISWQNAAFFVMILGLVMSVLGFANRDNK